MALKSGSAKDFTLVLQELSDADVGVRRKASSALEREARKVSAQERRNALGNRTATRAIICALTDTDRIVARNAVIAIAEVSRRYFKDDRAYDAVIPLLDSPDQLTRQWAANAAVALRGEESWPHVAPLVQDRSAQVRAAVLLLGANLAAHTVLSPTVLEQLQTASATGVGDENPQVREYATNLQRHLAAVIATRLRNETASTTIGG